MKKKYNLISKIGACFTILLSCITLSSSAQVDVSASAATPTATYTTLKAAFDAINAGTHQGNITIGISASTTETASAVLNSSAAGSALYTSVLIQPTVDGVSISGASAQGRGLIELNGADDVTIDGDNPNTAGINRNLTITNTALNTVIHTSVIRLAVATTVITSANNNTVRNLIVNGSATGRNDALATLTTGSENASYGIYVGGGASTASSTNAPTGISSVTTLVGSGATFNNLSIINNQVNACGRGIYVGGSNINVCNSLNVSNNIVGSDTPNNPTTV